MRGTLALVMVAGIAACGDPAESDRPGRLLVTSGFTDRLFVLDAGSGQILDSLDLDRRPGERDEPHGVTVAPDGRHFYVTLAHGEPSLSKFETEGFRQVGRITLDARGASRVRLSPDGSVAAIPDYWLSGGGEPSRVTFVATKDLTVLAAPTVCPAPHDAAYAPDGERIAVACALTDEIVLLDATDFSVSRRIAVGGASGGEVRPLNIAWLDDAALLVTLHRGAGTVRVDVDSAAVPGEAPWAPGIGAAQVAVLEGVTATANRGSGTVSVVREGNLVDIPLNGAHPHGVAFGTSPDVAYVTWEGDTDSLGGVAAVDTRSGVVLWATEVGVFTLGVAYLPG